MQGKNMRFRTHTALLIALCLSLAACGTTVPLSSRTAAGNTNGNGLRGDSTLSTDSAVDGATTDDGATGVTGSPAVGTKASGRTGPANTPAKAATGPLAPVQVGIVYATGQEDAAAAFGGGGGGEEPEFVDQRAVAQAYVNWINANGGLNGHPIQPVWTEFAFSDTRSTTERASAWCAQWTQDNKVVAGFQFNPFPNDLARCLQEKGVLYVQFGWTLHTQAEYRQLPYMWNPGELAVDHLAAAYADRLADANFFPKGAKVGLLVNDYPAAQEGRRIIKSRLGARGVNLDDANIYTIPQPAGWGAVPQSLSALQNAQLKMRASGVTHVLFLCWGCATFFMLYADNQNWAPIYGFTSDDLVNGIPGADPDMARRQLQGAMGVGWWPMMDSVTFGNPAAPLNDTWRLCQKILEPLGQGTKTQGDQIPATAFCSGLMFLRAAAASSGANPVTGATLRQGAERLGTSYQDPISLHTNLGSTRHSGVDRGRIFRFVDSCACFRYDATEFAIP
jgi:hypothetical protein